MKYNTVNVIRSATKKGWAIISVGRNRAIKIFDYPEQAYHYAMQISDKVFVHNENGTVKFVTNNINIKFIPKTRPMCNVEVCAPKQIIKYK